jgi:hypothetical protein
MDVEEQLGVCVAEEEVWGSVFCLLLEDALERVVLGLVETVELGGVEKLEQGEVYAKHGGRLLHNATLVFGLLPRWSPHMRTLVPHPLHLRQPVHRLFVPLRCRSRVSLTSTPAEPRVAYLLLAYTTFSQTPCPA